jgi:hypothetical protein
LKVLFLARDDDFDFHQDLVVHGLADVLGAENLLVHPHVERYHMPPPSRLKHVAMSYPNLPRTAGAPLAELAAEADVAIVGSLRTTALDGLRSIVELGFDKPRAVLDGLDDPYVRRAVEFVDLYFKRETLLHTTRLRLRFPVRHAYYALRRHPQLRHEFRRQVAVARLGTPKLVPLPFGVVPIDFPRGEARTYDVAFLGAATHPLRAQVVEEVRALREEGFSVLVPDDPLSEEDRFRWRERLTWSEYMRALSSSRISLSVRGDGFDTYRYWEIPYAGSMLLSETPRTVIPDNFVGGVEAVFAEPGQLVATARRLLETDAPERIAAAGHEKLLAKHLSRHRAQTVLDHLAAKNAPRKVV